MLNGESQETIDGSCLREEVNPRNGHDLFSPLAGVHWLLHSGSAIWTHRLKAKRCLHETADSLFFAIVGMHLQEDWVALFKRRLAEAMS